MLDSTVVQGIVLDTSHIKEYDKRLVILTVELGRITVFANGARRKNSPLTAVSQKFVMGAFSIRPSGSGAYTLISANIRNTFLELSYDLDQMAYASYACELIGYFTREGINAADELNLLYVTFNAILSGRPALGLIKSIFEFKLLDIEGMITVEEVINKYQPNNMSQDAVTILELILSKEISELYTFDVGDRVSHELGRVSEIYLKTQCDRSFKSLDILKPLL